MDLQIFGMPEIYFAEPDRLRLLAFCSGFFILWILVLIFRILSRPRRTHGSKYNIVGSMWFWLFVIFATVPLIGAFARPFTAEGSIMVTRGSVDAIFIVDYSSSMFLKDTGWSRLDIATREILKLISNETIREGDRVSLFVVGSIGSKAFTFTSDIGGFTNSVSNIRRPKSLNGTDNTYWDSSIGTSLSRVITLIDRQDMADILGEDGWDDNWRPIEKSNRFAIIFSDGDFFSNFQDEEELPGARLEFNQALDGFRSRGIEVYPVGIGTTRRVPLLDILKDYEPSREYDLNLVKELEGQYSSLDPASLNRIVSRTRSSGPFTIGDVSGDASGFLYSAIDQYRTTSVEPYLSQDKEELWLYFVLAALVVFIVGLGRYYAVGALMLAGLWIIYII